jgi:ADP-ribose pyrophosphatase YjhB (NUDIX family)
MHQAVDSLLNQDAGLLAKAVKPPSFHRIVTRRGKFKRIQERVRGKNSRTAEELLNAPKVGEYKDGLMEKDEFYEIVHVLFLNLKDGTVGLQLKRKSDENEQIWGPTGGHLETTFDTKGEPIHQTPIEAAIDETFEENGLPLHPHRFKKLKTIDGSKKKRHPRYIAFYVIMDNTIGPFYPDRKHVLKIQFFKPAEITRGIKNKTFPTSRRFAAVWPKYVVPLRKVMRKERRAQKNRTI